MDVVEFLKEKRRICEAQTNCSNCPLNRRKDLTCSNFISQYPDEAVLIVERWSKAYPRKTILQDFIEKYPNAPLVEDKGVPNICPHFLGYPKYKNCCDFIDKDTCIKCWIRSLE